MRRRGSPRRSFRRRWWWAASAAAIVALGSSETARSVIGAAARDASALLDGRSPGLRDSGALVQTKPGRSRTAPAPHQRVLSNERSRPPGSLPEGLPDDPLAVGAPGDLADPVGPFPGGSGAEPAGGAQPLSSAPPAAGALPIGTVPTNVPSVTPAVPEPDTYLLLATGIGVIGAMQRRRRRRNAADPTGEAGSRALP